GTPVVATPVGALPEIVDHGRTGFLATDETALAAAIARAGELDPTACRRAAEGRWDERRMVADYLALYREASATLGAGRAPAHPSSATPATSSS
ncbi:MAG TPA: glycosyltransferase, partial [Thermoanaerobaculia bacterium]|nr:glycosyltransferase [Thermoanaerobaculia bacterium]